MHWGGAALTPVNASASGSRANLVQAGTIEALAGEMLFVLHKFGYLERPAGGGGGGAAEDSAEMGDEEAAEALGALGLEAARRRGPWIECRGGVDVGSGSMSVLLYCIGVRTCTLRVCVLCVCVCL